jgi:hypothetical protein
VFVVSIVSEGIFFVINTKENFNGQHCVNGRLEMYHSHNHDEFAWFVTMNSTLFVVELLCHKNVTYFTTLYNILSHPAIFDGKTDDNTRFKNCIFLCYEASKRGILRLSEQVTSCKVAVAKFFEDKVGPLRLEA